MVYRISSSSPSFIEDITKTYFGLFFSGHSVLCACVGHGHVINHEAHYDINEIHSVNM